MRIIPSWGSGQDLIYSGDFWGTPRNPKCGISSACRLERPHADTWWPLLELQRKSTRVLVQLEALWGEGWRGGKRTFVSMERGAPSSIRVQVGSAPVCAQRGGFYPPPSWHYRTSGGGRPKGIPPLGGLPDTRGCGMADAQDHRCNLGHLPEASLCS